MGSQPEYSLPVERAVFSGFLFDMDGTIIDSTPAVIQHWTNIAGELGIDPLVILETSHGRRSIDVLQVLSPERANWEYVTQMEAQLPKLYGDSAVEIPGARALLDDLTSRTFPWAIVTSGTQPLVSGWLARLALARPQHLISAESVAEGKPHPDGYLQGLEALGLAGRGHEVLVLEDSPAGIRAARDAGCRVVGLVTSHSAREVAAAGPDWIVRDLQSLTVRSQDGDKVVLEIANGLRL